MFKLKVTRNPYVLLNTKYHSLSCTFRFIQFADCVAVMLLH